LARNLDPCPPFGALSLKKRILENVWTFKVFQKLEITGDVEVLVWLSQPLLTSLFFIGEILSKRTIDNWKFEKLSDFGGVHARSEGRKIVKIPRFQYLAFSVNKIWNDY